ncbi:hypothetical protein DPMN_173541 [Dreissena polymorpha]|uniref:Uncharacterized protein n=1 Tax=Dreissena polymorpha TaxID=45954 RepID=A0A9D4IHP5_DREPO|nr:hypothetical protein DPMN_173541 [Dreissena polymorpha]
MTRPPGSNAFQQIVTVSKLIQYIITTTGPERSKISFEQNVLTKFHEQKNIHPPGSHVFSSLNVDRTINVASRVKNALPPVGHIFQATGTIFKLDKQALPPDGHVFQPNRTNFELVQIMLGTNVLIKFYEARTINVASRG